MPSSENLKKQAKLFLRWHRDGYYPVAAQIRAFLPRFSEMSDGQILAERFVLSDAQELVARRSGFPSWPALKEGLETMPAQDRRIQSRPILTAAEPQIFVADVKASCDFYTQTLGFTVAFAYGEPQFYAQVRRDIAALNLRLVHEPIMDREIVMQEQLLSASITLSTSDDVRQLFLEFEAADADFHQTLKLEPWGAKVFIVKDPDGNLILFAGPAG